MLGYARRQVVVQGRVRLDRCLQEHEPLLQSLIGEDIELRLQPGEDLPEVELDPSQLHQVLTNLCANARDAISGFGLIVLECRLIRIDEEFAGCETEWEPGPFVELKVSDSGEGMKDAVRQRIFEPFFSTKEMGRGTGLGLATVYGIVKQCRGKIRVASEGRVGSSFSILLRPAENLRQTTKAPHAAYDKPETAGAESPVVLVVEPRADLLRALARSLGDHGITARAVRTPEEALSAAKELEKLDLLLCEAVLPDSNGRDLAIQVEHLHPRMRTLFYSEFPCPILTRRNLIDREARCIPLPVNSAELVRAICDCMAED